MPTLLRGCNNSMICMMIRNHSAPQILGPSVAFDGSPSGGANQENKEIRERDLLLQPLTIHWQFTSELPVVAIHWPFTCDSNTCNSLAIYWQFAPPLAIHWQFTSDSNTGNSLAIHLQFTSNSLERQRQFTGNSLERGNCNSRNSL